MDQPTFSLEGREINNNEDLSFLWIIPNFGNRAEAADINPDVNAKKFIKAEFSTCEGSNSLKPNWEFFLAVGPNKTIHIGLQYSGSENCPAECEVYFKSPAGKLLHASTLEKQEYAEGSIVTCRLDQNIGPQDNLQEYFHNEVLQLQLNVTIPNRTPDLNQYKMDILRAFKNGLDSRVGSDVTFVFEEEDSENVIAEMRAHKAILSFHSPVFAEMFLSVTTPGTQTRVKITEMSPRGMEILLKFLYSGEIDEDWKSIVEELIHASDKYQMEQLQTFLRENIAFALTVKNAQMILNWGDAYEYPEVAEAAMKFLRDKFQDLIRTQNQNLSSKDTEPKDD